MFTRSNAREMAKDAARLEEIAVTNKVWWIMNPEDLQAYPLEGVESTWESKDEVRRQMKTYGDLEDTKAMETDQRDPPAPARVRELLSVPPVRRSGSPPKTNAGLDGKYWSKKPKTNAGLNGKYWSK